MQIGKFLYNSLIYNQSFNPFLDILTNFCSWQHFLKYKQDDVSAKLSLLKVSLLQHHIVIRIHSLNRFTFGTNEWHSTRSKLTKLGRYNDVTLEFWWNTESWVMKTLPYFEDLVKVKKFEYIKNEAP